MSAESALPAIHPESVLLVTLDSCRFDTFSAARLPNLRAVGPLHRAMSPGSFTFASHAAMFVGFTPGDASRREPYINPKFGKIFRMAGVGFEGRGTDHFILEGRNIIDGFKRKGYVTIGSGAVPWFNPQRPTSLQLVQDFEHYFWPGDKWSIRRQIEFVADHLPGAERPAFVFINVGETHIPYYHEGAGWDRHVNPCVPFGDHNDAEECRRRQTACVEDVDQAMGPLLRAFAHASTVVCADHGDCWGEDDWTLGPWHFSPQSLRGALAFSSGAAAPTECDSCRSIKGNGLKRCAARSISGTGWLPKKGGAGRTIFIAA